MVAKATRIVLKSGAWGAWAEKPVAKDEPLEVISASGRSRTELVAKVITNKKNGAVVCMTKEVEPDHRRVLIRMATGVIEREDPSLAEEIRDAIPDHVDDKMDLLAAAKILEKVIGSVSRQSKEIAKNQATVALKLACREAEVGLPRSASQERRRAAWLAYANGENKDGVTVDEPPAEVVVSDAEQVNVKSHPDE